MIPFRAFEYFWNMVWTRFENEDLEGTISGNWLTFVVHIYTLFRGRKILDTALDSLFLYIVGLIMG
jgi:hypothetical protein